MKQPVDVVTSTEAATAQLVVCKLLTIPLILPDNLVARCFRCLRAVQHRPETPDGPRKMCFDCAEPLMRAAQARNDLRVMITAKSVAEVAEYRRKGNLG